MRILMTGATGFLGQAIARELLLRDHDLVIVTRDAKKTRRTFPYPADVLEWDPAGHDALPAGALEGVQSIIHLAGEPIAEKRWSSEQKSKIRDSRVLGTRHLWQGIAHARARGETSGFKTFVSASAIGIFGDRPDGEPLTETSAPGEGFLAEVCKAWEKEIFPLGFDEIRQVAVRVGIVLGAEGGALPKLLPIFKAGLGGPIASGQQWMSWIHVEDLVQVFVHAVENGDYRGPLNAVAPHPVTNAEFGKALGSALGRPAILPVPKLALQVALGEMSHVVLDSARVRSDALGRLGFRFKHPELRETLEGLCAPGGEPDDEQFVAEQWLPRQVDELFPFFADAKNLEDITPPWLGFKIKRVSTPEIQEGTIIDYRLSLHGLPMHWQTLIKDWRPNSHFVDNQEKGPYRKWHHTHSFQPMKGGTLMRDRVLYRLPLGRLGKGVAHWKIRRDIGRIFDYRRQRLTDLFRSRQ